MAKQGRTCPSKKHCLPSPCISAHTASLALLISGCLSHQRKMLPAGWADSFLVPMQDWPLPWGRRKPPIFLWNRYTYAWLPYLTRINLRETTSARNPSGERKVITCNASLWGLAELVSQVQGARWWEITYSGPRPAGTWLGCSFPGWYLLHTATTLLVWTQSHSAPTLGATAPVCTGYSSPDQECARENWLSH